MEVLACTGVECRRDSGEGYTPYALGELAAQAEIDVLDQQYKTTYVGNMSANIFEQCRTKRLFMESQRSNA